MYCVKCEEFLEDFNHVFLCLVTSIAIDELIVQLKNHLCTLINNHVEDTCSHVSPNEISILDIWNNSFSDKNFMIINLFKGIIPSLLSNFIKKKVKQKKIVESILTSFRNYLLKYTKILWNDRCELQHEKESSLGINRHLKNLSINSLTGKKFTSNNIIDRTDISSAHHRGMENIINFGGTLRSIYNEGGPFN